MRRAIDWDGEAIVALDQTQLPTDERFFKIDNAASLAEAIRGLRIRGAPALGVAGALGIALAVREAQRHDRDLRAAVDEVAALLIATRPTAVNLRWGVDEARRALTGGPDAVVRRAVALLEADVETNRKIAERGADWIDAMLARGRPLRVMTHCNTGALACVELGTALGIIQVSYSRGALAHVFATETRPLLQGTRLTAWELSRLCIPFTLVTDGAAPSLMARGMIDAVIVGADRIAANGDVANKIGTYPLGLAARRAGIPFVVAAPESTIDCQMASGESIPIEERDEEEVLSFGGLRVAPLNAHALNPAFDVTPTDLVTAIVTESRVIEHD
jgi:S-methyl-5-thioribose-1-phosphate isomerase